ncbi:hypothetical protein A2U01_0044962, partial [Trifolium medium]|nr:hypothetical protein [Trifolium medium]
DRYSRMKWMASLELEVLLVHRSCEVRVENRDDVSTKGDRGLVCCGDC